MERAADWSTWLARNLSADCVQAARLMSGDRCRELRDSGISLGILSNNERIQSGLGAQTLGFGSRDFV